MEGGKKAARGQRAGECIWKRQKNAPFRTRSRPGCQALGPRLFRLFRPRPRRPFACAPVLLKNKEEFRKKSEKPILKGAYVDAAVFIGDNQLDALAALKSKNEVIGDIIGLLQSPAKNVVSALKSGGGKLAGIIKTLSEK